MRVVRHLLDANTVLAVDPGLELAVTVVELNADTVVQNAARLAALDEVLLQDVGQTPESGGVNLLAASNLVLSTTESLEGVLAHVLAATDGTENLANVHTSHGTVGLTEGTAHTSLKTISTSARKHLVDADDVEGVDADADVESILTGALGHVLVTCDTASLEGLGGDLLELVGHQVSAEWEVVDRRLLAAKVVDTNLGIWHTTAIPRLDVRLVLLVAVALGWAAKRERGHARQHDAGWPPILPTIAQDRCFAYAALPVPIAVCTRMSRKHLHNAPPRTHARRLAGTWQSMWPHEGDHGTLRAF